MLEAKMRLVSAERLLARSEPISGVKSLDYEFCFLQIRRIVECIAFAAMVREAARYEKLRVQQKSANVRDHGDATKDWQAGDILNRLVQISAHALPIPISSATQLPDRVVHFDRAKIEVTHGRLIDLYKQCGGYLHGKNPLVDDFSTHVERERRKYKGAPVQISRALTFLRALLWRHAAVVLEWSEKDNPTSKDGPRASWILDFGSDDSHEILLILGEAQ